MLALELRGVSKRYGKTIALDDLSFAVEEGSVTGFLGPNGSGKTTTIRILTGLVRPTNGEALVMGMAYASLPNPLRVVGVALEPNAFNPGRRARDHMALVARAAGIPAGRIDDLIENVGLAEAAHRRIGEFSLGMRQRLSLATALLGDPQVLIADEPSNGLDPQGIRWVRDFLRGLARDGRTVLVSSHQLAELALAADSVVIIDRGRLIRQGDIDELGGVENQVVIRTPEAAVLEAAMREAGLTVSRSMSDELVVDAASDLVGAVVARSGVVVYEMHTERPSLEDTFLKLTTERQSS